MEFEYRVARASGKLFEVFDYDQQRFGYSTSSPFATRRPASSLHGESIMCSGRASTDAWFTTSPRKRAA